MKETILQFGEGGFLRSFVDYFIDGLNKQKLYIGKIVVVQPIEQGMVSILNEQDGKYNLFLRGIKDGKVIDERHKIESISRGIDPYADYHTYLELAQNPDLRFIVSNTTEAGIEYLGTEHLTDKPPKSFPAKLTAFLYERYKANLNGFIILPCELIDHNGDELKKCILQYAGLWNLGIEFESWLIKENVFCNTLVDRICTGYPSDEKEALLDKIGYEDKLIDTAEIFHLWVIEGNFEAELPLQKAGFNVIWTDNAEPYKKRKVRILNGAHTSIALGAYLYGLKTVGECLNDAVISAYLKKCIFDEIVPVLGNSKEDIEFGLAVLERFSNPFIKHLLLSIALNSVSKFKVRVLPTILEYKNQKGIYPPCLTFSLASLILFYKEKSPNDSKEIVDFMRKANVKEILENEKLWDRDLSDMYESVITYVEIYRNKDEKEWYQCVLSK